MATETRRTGKADQPPPTHTASSSCHPLLDHLRPHVLTLVLFLTLAAIALNDLVLHFATAIPDSWDYAIFYWNMWWVKYALFTLHRDPMFSNYVLYPDTVNLALHTTTFTLGLLTAPLQFILDLKLIYNGLMVGSFVASGYVTFLFLRRHVQNDWVAAFGGAIFAFTPTTIARASAGHLNLAQAWWLPLELLLWDAVIAQRSSRSRVIWAVGLGLSLYLAWMNDIQLMLWIMPLLAPYAVYTWIAQCQGRERLRVIGLVLLAGASTLGPALLEPIPAILQTRGMQFAHTDPYTLAYHSYQLRWLLVHDPERSGESVGQMLPLLALFSLPLAGRRRRRWAWFVLGLGLFTLALGPYLYGTRIPLPYLLVHRLLGEQYRTPVRFTTPASLAMIMFISLSLANLFDRFITLRWQPWLVGAAITGLVLDSGMLAPFPIKFMPDYRIYHEIGRDPEEYALLEVPVGPASGFGEFGTAPDLQYYSYIHHKQIINGIVSRLPVEGLSRFERSPLLRGLTGLYDLPAWEVASRELADKLNRWNMRYVLVHRDRLEPDRTLKIVQFLNVQPILCLVDEEGNLLAYRRIQAWTDCPRPEMSALPTGTTRLELGEPGHVRYLGPGWYDIENIGGPEGRWAGETYTATLRLVLPPQNTRIHFRALAYPTNQTVTISINGHTIATLKLISDWAEYELTVPGEALRVDGPSIITLSHTQLESAFQRTGGATPDQRPLAAAYDYFVFEPAR